MHQAQGFALHAPCFFMSDYIIKVENLGKKYKIRHQQVGSGMSRSAMSSLKKWRRRYAGSVSMEHGA